MQAPVRRGRGPADHARALHRDGPRGATRGRGDPPGGTRARSVRRRRSLSWLWGRRKHDDDRARRRRREAFFAPAPAPRAPRLDHELGLGRGRVLADGVRRSVQARAESVRHGRRRVRPRRLGALGRALLPALPPPRGVRRALAGVARGGGREGRAEAREDQRRVQAVRPDGRGLAERPGERRRNRGDAGAFAADGFRMLRRLRRRRRRGRRGANDARASERNRSRLETTTPRKKLSSLEGEGAV